MFQGGSLSVLLFILLVSPLSFLLHKCQGYACGKHEKYNVTHNFFAEDLKLNMLVAQTLSKRNSV